MKFPEYKTIAKRQNYSVINNVCKACPICEFVTWQIYLLRLFAKIKFSRKFLFLQYPINYQSCSLVCLYCCFTSQSTLFESCWDDFLSSWVEPVLRKRIKCLAQGHNSDSGVSQTSNPSIPSLMLYQLSHCTLPATALKLGVC